MASINPVTTNVDDEVGIPPDATLTTPANLLPSTPVKLAFSSPSDGADASSLSDLITIANNNPKNSSLETDISLQSSIRETARCIIIGRQASASDIRVDHKSVSRRHTGIYYKQTKENIYVVVIQDLGGKHGTYVNNQRLEKHGKVELSLEEKEGGAAKKKVHFIRFGNAPVNCQIIIIPELPKQQQQNEVLEEEKEDQLLSSQPLQEKEVEANKVDKSSSDHENNDDDAPSTRESREAQIAAMIASLDTAPQYKKYTPVDEEDNNMILGGGNSNATLKSNGSATSNIASSGISNEHNLPITSSITLSPGSDSFTSSDGTGTSIQSNSSVSALCFEPSGSRIVAGHRDGTLRYYAFNGMKPTTSFTKTTYAPFRIVDSYNDPLDSTGRHVVTSLNVSSSGGQWIVGTTSSQPRVVDREGRNTLYHFIKGDTYVTDSSNTKGHTAGVSGVAFHPLGQEICWSCSYDGSIRQWDISGRGKTQFQKLVCQKIIGKCKNEKGQRTQIVSNLAVHPNGRKIVIGTSCGSIQIWSCFGSSVSTRPLGAVYSAHGSGTTTKPVTFVTFIGDGSKIASRSDSDDTVRIWSVEKMEKDSGGSFNRKRSGDSGHSPSLLLAICKDLPALNESANCAFSPDATLVCAGTSVNPREPNCCGKLKFYRLPEETKSSNKPNKETKKKKKETALLDPIVELDVAPNASVLVVQWHPKLNQIAVGTSDGLIHILYDQIVSSKGALIPTARSVRPSDGLSDLLRTRAPTGSAAFLTSSSSDANIKTPHSLPLFREEARATRKVKEEVRKDPEKTKLPQPPSSGIKTGTGAGGSLTLAQSVYSKNIQKIVKNKNIAGQDPREELFKHNEGKSYLSKAYEGDVQRILAEKTVEEEMEDQEPSSKRAKH